MTDDRDYHELASQPEPTELNGIQIGTMLVYTGLSGLVAVAASTLFSSLVYRLAVGLNAFLLTFGILVLFGLLFLDDSEKSEN